MQLDPAHKVVNFSVCLKFIAGWSERDKVQTPAEKRALRFVDEVIRRNDDNKHA